MVKRNQRGITLIALVITIIVLLILAGVTINVLLGQDGIINRTQQAKEQHEYAAAKEIIDLKLVEIYTDAVSNNEEYTMSKITTGMTDDTTITIDEKYFNATASLKTGISDSIANLKGIVVSANQYERFKFLVSGVNGSIQVIGYTTETIPNTWTTGDLPTGFIAIGESKQATPPGATTYTVTFKDGETTLSTATVEEGKTATKPTDPTKDGYEFVNWYSDSELTNLFDFTSTITGNTTIYAKWEEISSTSARALLLPLPTGEKYNTGDEVYFNVTGLENEKFFVISDDGTNVKLLAKYCLLRDTSEQGTKDITWNGEGTAGYGRTFSNTNYWEKADSSTYPLDLQSSAMITRLEETSGETPANNAILKAKEYGQRITEATGVVVTGKLMDYSTAETLKDTNSEIFYGRWTDGTQPTDGWMNWWLGWATKSGWVKLAGGGMMTQNMNASKQGGVRPVLEFK